jgi:c-di-GMP-binding flagellar brake protein YcgR
MEERQLNDQEEIFQLPDIGSMLQVQLLHHSDRIHSKFIGMDPGRYLIAAVPNHHESHMNFSKDDLIVVRYMAGGTIYGFESKVMGVVQQPSCILFMKYPDKITSCEVRNQTRFDCTFYCEAHIKEESYSGLLTNISLGGCQYVTNRLDEEKAETIVLGDIITLNFNSIDGEFFKSVPVEVRNIRRYNNRVEIGLRFISLNDTMKNKLIHSIKTLALLGKTCS